MKDDRPIDMSVTETPDGLVFRNLGVSGKFDAAPVLFERQPKPEWLSDEDLASICRDANAAHD